MKTKSKIDLASSNAYCISDEDELIADNNDSTNQQWNHWKTKQLQFTWIWNLNSTQISTV